MCSSLWMSATSVGGHSTCKAISSIVPSLLSEAAILAGSPASSQATSSYHQDPTYAIGYVTFYNGQFSPITPAGTQLSTQEGKAVVTTQTATVPGIDQSANPPALGEATIPARAVTMGAGGNIDAY